MIKTEYSMIAGDGSDVGAIIAQALAKSSWSLQQKNKLSVEAMNKVVRRSLGKTGSTLKGILKLGVKNNTLGLAPMRRYTKTDVVMSMLLKAVKPSSLDKYSKLFMKMLGKVVRPPGYRFANMFEFKIAEETSSGSGIEVGILRENSNRGGSKWADIFENWQDADIVDTYFSQGSDKRTHGYFGALGMPLKAGTETRRPERKIIDKVQQDEDPSKMFEKFFLERLLK